MAGINYPKWTYGETTTWKRTVDESIILVNQAATPLLRQISPNLNNLPVPCEHTKYEWVEDELELLESMIGGTATGGSATSPTPTGAAGTGDTTLYVSYAEGEYFLKGHILAVDDELMLVTTAGTSADAIVVVRGAMGTTDTTHTAGSTVRIVGRSHPEGGDATTDTYRVATMPYNNTQIWQAEFEFTSTEQAIARYGNVNRFDYLEAKVVKNQMKMMERNVMEGWRATRTTRHATTFAETQGFSGGLADTTAAYIYSGNRNSVSAALTRKHILDLLQEIFGLVGVEYMPTHIVVNSWVKRKINDMFETYVRTERSESVGGAQIETLSTDYGDVDILLTNQIRADIAYLLHMPFLAIGPLQGEEFRTVELAKTTEGMTKYQVWGEYTYMFKNPKCHGSLTGISTTT